MATQKNNLRFMMTNGTTEVDAKRSVVRVQYLPAHEVANLAAHSGEDLLGVIAYGRTCRQPQDTEYPWVSVDMPQLGGEPLLEVWTSTAGVEYAHRKGIGYASNEAMLFGFIRMEETPGKVMETLAFEAYRRILDLIETSDHRHLLRVWNYFPRINDEVDGLECYKRFCLGRHKAFEEHNPAFPGDLPAASAVGTQSPGLVVYFVAGREPGVRYENPRQVSAFKYPAQYGPRSPSFSRAMVKQWGVERHLYVAGTASIVGHETRHVDDVQQQLNEIVRNLEALLTHIAGSEGIPERGLNLLSLLKVYLRHPEHLELVKSALAGSLPREMPILYLAGDICRRNLLLEIEGIGIHPEL